MKAHEDYWYVCTGCWRVWQREKRWEILAFINNISSVIEVKPHGSSLIEITHWIWKGLFEPPVYSLVVTVNATSSLNYIYGTGFRNGNSLSAYKFMQQMFLEGYVTSHLLDMGDRKIVNKKDTHPHTSPLIHKREMQLQLWQELQKGNSGLCENVEQGGTSKLQVPSLAQSFQGHRGIYVLVKVARYLNICG